MSYLLYILYSPAVNRFYIGSTSDITKRIYYHNNGRSPYTKNKGPWFLVYQEEFETREDAVYRERELKKWKSSKRIIEELRIDICVCGHCDPDLAG